IEVKAKPLVPDRDLAGLRALKEERIFKRFYVVSLEERPRRTEDKIEILPIEVFFKRLLAGDL
ncbi:MAG: hypothetical protein AAB425_13420, partial [Bdellovibrionota bacterium]